MIARKPLDLPPAVARAFVKNMRIKRAIQSRQFVFGKGIKNHQSKMASFGLPTVLAFINPLSIPIRFEVAALALKSLLALTASCRCHHVRLAHGAGRQRDECHVRSLRLQERLRCNSAGLSTPYAGLQLVVASLPMAAVYALTEPCKMNDVERPCGKPCKPTTSSHFSLEVWTEVRH